MVKHFYLSPHPDDAALSCGGHIALQAAHGEPVRVLNFFVGVPNFAEEQFSAYAQKQHRTWNLKPNEAMLARRREDQAVLKELGAEAENWDYYDAIYRTAGTGFLYTAHEKTFGPIHPSEYLLIEQLTQRLKQLHQAYPQAVFYAPLRVGGHVDHSIVRECAVKLHGQGAKVVFYEDFPYVAKKEWKDEPTTVTKAVAELPFHVEPHLITIDAEAKIKALLGYKSQLKALFGIKSALGLASMIYDYGAEVALNRGFPAQVYGEQYWHPR